MSKSGVPLTAILDVGAATDIIQGLVAWAVDKHGPAMMQLYMEQASKAYSWKDAKTFATAAYVLANKFVDSYESRGKGTGFADFRQDWRKLRLCIGLQARLILEQVLYDRGPPWNRMYTGFKPVD